MKSLKFFCPSCDRITTLEEVMVEVTVGSTISYIHSDGECEYDEQTNEGGSIERFQCSGCGFILRQVGGSPVTEYEQLAEWLQKHKPPAPPENSVTHGELVQRIADGHEQLDGKDMERLWNQMFDDQVKYVGDSIYKWVGQDK